jgi:hypothetical protein
MNDVMEALVAEAPRDVKAHAKWRARNVARLSPAALYLQRLLVWINGLTTAFHRLEMARALLGKSPAQLGPKRTALDRNQWADYHFTVFTASLVTVSECCLLLVAEAYQLGIPPRLCSVDNVTSNRWVQNSAAHEALKKLAKTLTRERDRRNRYLHRGESVDFQEIDEIEDRGIWMALGTITAAASMGVPILPDVTLGRMWRMQMGEILPRLDSLLREVRLDVNSVQKAVLEEAQRRLPALGAVKLVTPPK